MRPILFEIFGFPIPSYEFFVGLGVLAGAIIVFLERRRRKLLQENFFFIAVAALLGGALGAKIPIWLYYARHIAAHPGLETFLSGRTIVGGIIGGWAAVAMAKKKLGVHTKTGDIFAPALALGEAIGRIGCFLRGCCGGTATRLPWAMDFGDGVLRHPTQLYTLTFDLILFMYLWSARKKYHCEGNLFLQYLAASFTFRFFLEFIRTTPKIFYGLSGFQLVAVPVVLYSIVALTRRKNVSAWATPA
ncbi:MAG: prolipoprotein diacylglyceryl transferase [Patescibacteria group bacterium]|nr:prolipoprotein diacylglyceryl transferase [Patescibacteria group bacterium]